MRGFRQLVQASAMKLGYRISRLEPGDETGHGATLRPFFAALKGHGFAPRRIFDVGANHGAWTRVAIAYFPDASYTLIEPQDHLKRDVQDLIDRGHRIRWINAGAGDKPGPMTFWVSPHDDSSSFVATPEDVRRWGMRQVTVGVRTLNDIVGESGEPPPDMLKIDAEGFDLKVLAGATDLLGKTDVILVEAAVCSPCENTLLNVINRMAEAGYRAIDITDLNRSTKHGVLWLCEVAFLRNGSDLLRDATAFS
jgi:FkbM family methyltransferase